MAKYLRCGTCSRGIDNFDNFNKLPDEVVVYIVSLLKFREAVRTCILSKRWRYLFVSMSHLNFKFDYSKGNMVGNAAGFVNVVDKLFRFRERRLIIDRLDITCTLARLLQRLKIQTWMEHAMWHGIRELDLATPYGVVLPASLFTSKTLEVLKVLDLSHMYHVFTEDAARFEVPNRVCLPNLKVLYLTNLCFADDDALNRIVFNCPVLQVFDCHLSDNDRKLSVISTTLKKLAIQFVCSRSWSGSFDVVLNVPNINYFRYSVNGITSQTIVLGPALVEASYNFQQVWGDCRDYVSNATALLRSLQNIQTLRINDAILLSIKHDNIPLPDFVNLTRLVITLCRLGLYALPDFLAHCVSLQILDFRDASSRSLFSSFEEPDVSLTSCVETIKFRNFAPVKVEFEIVKYFLKTARVLKSMEIHLGSQRDDDDLVILEEELLGLPRISKECKFRILPFNPREHL